MATANLRFDVSCTLKTGRTKSGDPGSGSPTVEHGLTLDEVAQKAEAHMQSMGGQWIRPTPSCNPIRLYQLYDVSEVIPENTPYLFVEFDISITNDKQ